MGEAQRAASAPPGHQRAVRLRLVLPEVLRAGPLPRG